MAHNGTNRDRRAAPFRGSATTNRASCRARVARTRVGRFAGVGCRRRFVVAAQRRFRGRVGARDDRARRAATSAWILRVGRTGIWIEVPIVLVGEVVRNGIQARRQRAGAEAENAGCPPGAR